ncbi:Ger(x)C family spore germination protein [Anaerobacillus sp. 1_MG-2023]|uniref:Ger(x)C family spore germination protein n=1 Tax=Bacillales TaxID=1385 RepID=UPI0026E26EBB|nr:Ger(x)C family spore germination protein [Anaerobacillus sp. 1_MG-2023]MDO6654988.1 Ger(x)C family spore germination protein [Anaerobacillus sp. 1_MG-2023]
MKYCSLMLLCMLLTGCVAEEIIDEVPILFIVGYDKGEEEKIKGTISLQTFDPNQEVETRSFEAEAYTSKGLRNQLSGLPKPISIGKMAVLLFSEDMAEEGIIDVLDSFLRDPAAGRLIYVGVVEGSAGELIKNEFQYLQGIGPFLQNLIKQSIEYGNMPQNNIHLFDYKYYGDGMDPVVPILKKEKTEVKITGLALFEDEKMVGKLNLDEMFMFALINKSFSAGLYELELPDGEYANLQKIKSKVKYKVKNGNTNPSVNISIKLNGNIVEYTGDKLSKETKQEIAKALERKVKAHGDEMVKKFQELGIDPFSIGDHARSQTRNFDFKKWYDRYPDVPVTIDVKVNIGESGIID